MKLLTLNCHAWQEENQLAKIQELAADIAEKGYDVIALQEVSQRMEGNASLQNIKENNYVFVLLEELKKLGVTEYQFIWGLSHIGFEVYEEGSAILTKHPIVEEYSFIISKHNDPNQWRTRRIVGAKIDYNGKMMNFYSCHLGWWTDEEDPFIEQVDVLISQLNQQETNFLMGDFNNSGFVRGEGYDYILSKGIHDTFQLAVQKDSGITVKGKIDGWDKNKADLRLDLILCNHQVKVASSKVIFNGENKAIVSDHFGVEVEIKI
ncbi:MAG: endonuclease/exonuclease/phosphatase family protein [Bacillaceae bacterium]